VSYSQGYATPLVCSFRLGMVQNRLFSLDRVVPLPAMGLGDFVEGYALHASRRNHQVDLNLVLGEIRQYTLQVHPICLLRDTSEAALCTCPFRTTTRGEVGGFRGRLRPLHLPSHGQFTKLHLRIP